MEDEKRSGLEDIILIRDATQEWRNVPIGKEYEFYRELKLNEPTVLYDGVMSIGFADLGNSSDIGEMLESLGLHRHQIMSIFENTIERKVVFHGGKYFGREGGDKVVYTFGHDPRNPTNSEIDSMHQIVDCSIEIQKAMLNEVSGEVLILVMAGIETNKRYKRETKYVDPVLFKSVYEEISQDPYKFEDLGREVQALISNASKAGKKGEITAKLIAVQGENFWTVTKSADPDGTNPYIITHSIDGPLADLGGRLFDKSSENKKIKIAYREARGMIATPKLRKKLDPNRFLVTETDAGIEVKTAYFWPDEVFGRKEFYHPNFGGKLPPGSYVARNVRNVTNNIEAIEGLLAGLSKKYEHTKFGFDVPESQRKDLFDHGLAKQIAAVALTLSDVINRSVVYVEGLKDPQITEDYKELSRIRNILVDFKPEKLNTVGLLFDMARYLEDPEQGYTLHPYDITEEQRLDRNKQFAIQGGFRLKQISELAKQEYHLLVENLYTSYKDLVEMFGDKKGNEIYYINHVINMSNDFIRLVTTRSHRPRYTPEKALQIVQHDYAGSALLEPFSLMLGEEKGRLPLRILDTTPF